MKNGVILAIMSLLILSTCACDINSNTDTNDQVEFFDDTVGEEFDVSSGEIFTERELADTYELSQSIEINLSTESQTILSEGTYIIKGSLTNGQIIIDIADTDKVQLILDNVDINCNYSAPIYIKSADKVFITSAENSINILSINQDFTDDENKVDGVIFSKSDISFNGSGTLEINSDYKHGIVGKDDVVFTNGIYNINTTKDAIQANDSIRTINAQFNIVSGKDGIQTKNDEDEDKGYIYFENTTINIESEEDSISATNYVLIKSGTYNINSQLDGIVADTFIKINGGTYIISTGGGYQKVLNSITKGEGSGGAISETDKLTTSMKAIKAVDIFINQGDITISSYEDGLNSDNNIIISDGTININSGDEAITAKNALTINGGTITIENGYEGFEGAYITINDGIIEINVLDDGMNANESFSILTINGGNLRVACQGDGLDTNGSLVITGGYIVLDVSAIYTGGDGNIDVTGTVTFTGGTIVDENGNSIDPTEELGGFTPNPGGGRPPVKN